MERFGTPGMFRKWSPWWSYQAPWFFLLDDCKGGARMRPLPSQFDPSNPGHRTTDEWAVADPLGWFHSAFVYALGHGEARVLLRAEVVLVLWWDAQACIVQVEEL
jgi:hypothetical protein